MLFGMFFGAGNLIFPIQMGQSAGTEFFGALAGFLTTAIGLPFLGILAMGLSGASGLKELADRVHPVFSLIFSVALSGIFMEPGAEGSALGGVGFGVGLINSGSIVSV